MKRAHRSTFWKGVTVMQNRGVLTKLLATAGTLLALFPVVVPIVFGVTRLIRMGQLMVDFLMPFELFFVVLAGAALLIWAAIRARSRLKLIAGSLVAALALAAIALATASLTGLDSNPALQNSIWNTLVMGLLIAADVAIAVMGVGGILLLLDLFRPAKQ